MPQLAASRRPHKSLNKVVYRGNRQRILRTSKMEASGAIKPTAQHHPNQRRGSLLVSTKCLVLEESSSARTTSNLNNPCHYSSTTMMTSLVNRKSRKLAMPLTRMDQIIKMAQLTKMHQACHRHQFWDPTKRLVGPDEALLQHLFPALGVGFPDSKKLQNNITASGHRVHQ